MQKTGIICTIGPASWDQKIISSMIDKGMVCARVNGAFADPNELDKVRMLVRAKSNKVQLMLDVKGPEVRLNKFTTPIDVRPGEYVIIGNNRTNEIYPSNYNNLYTHLKPGQRIIVGDGEVELILRKVVKDRMHCEVIVGNQIKPGKALSLPSATYATNVLTAKDEENLYHGIKTGWDSVSASFIQNANCANQVRDFINRNQGKVKLIAKIEDQQGVDNIDEILPVVDGIMIARGGLGVEVGLEKVPMIERFLINKAHEYNKPEITATQMLESMTENPRPTRAEVNDVATAVLLGSDFVMLSGESASGSYPVLAVEWMAKVIAETQKWMDQGFYESFHVPDKSSLL